MPAISVFYGLAVYLDNKRHKLPHIHVTYQSEEVVVSIADGSDLEGSIPNARMKLLQAWIELHKEEVATKVQAGTVVWAHEQDICPDTLYQESIKTR